MGKITGPIGPVKTVIGGGVIVKGIGMKRVPVEQWIKDHSTKRTKVTTVALWFLFAAAIISFAIFMAYLEHDVMRTKEHEVDRRLDRIEHHLNLEKP